MEIDRIVRIVTEIDIRPIGQIIGLIAVTISVFSYQAKTKNKILFLQVVSNSLNIVHYLLIQGYSGFYIKIVAVIRDSFLIEKEKHKKLNSKLFLYLFIIAYLLIAIFTYDRLTSIFVLFAVLVYTIIIWDGNEKSVRVAAVITCMLWLAYNVSVRSYPNMLSNAITLISAFIALIRRKEK